ncbi:MAG: winged helix DNA-binding protein [Cyclobacteriaceae bacterium]|nr:winged helix DNA-binding protein [Cyclobacteriaceae bacterium HetDA_MAG_MS6]
MNEILSLLNLWKEYTELGKPVDIQLFGKWLNEKDLRERKERSTGSFQADEEAMIGFYLGNVISFSEVWTKVCLRDLPIVGFGDYGVLNFILKKENPTKKEVVQFHVGENSTSFETIKRLMKQGLIEEKVDSEDRRLRRVRLTEEGKRVSQLALHQAMKLSRLLVGNLSDNEKKSLLQILEKLFNFHYNLYHQSDKEKVIENYGL